MSAMSANRDGDIDPRVDEQLRGRAGDRGASSSGKAFERRGREVLLAELDVIQTGVGSSGDRGDKTRFVASKLFPIGDVVEDQESAARSSRPSPNPKDRKTRAYGSVFAISGPS